jgi:pimeloyl-ACP methyl ester carboxylesterase
MGEAGGSNMSETSGYLQRDGERLAWRRTPGAGPTVVWLGGFRSDMTGTKAQALADWAAARGRAFLRFDYFAHGQSSGAFEDGTISRWRADALAVIDELTEGPLVLVGSSMGGWLSCLVALARPERLQALVLIAPAADFVERLMWARMDAEIRRIIAVDGAWVHTSADGDSYAITRAFIEDGRRWSILPGPVGITAPVRILQGGDDAEVPWRHALALAEAIESRDLVFTLIRGGDHRLSREADIARLREAVEEVERSA